MAKRDKLWGLLGILIFLFLNYPLLHIFNQDVLWAGIPVLFLYLYMVWILAIIGLYTFGKRSISRE
jgi:hypothetical protein